MDIVKKIEMLKTLGLDKIAERLTRKKDGKTKLLIALDKYKYATKQDIADFNDSIRKTGRELVIDEIKNYLQLPPDVILEELHKARELHCFDSFWVAHIAKVKDPILFGKINDFETLFFYIAQWGDDVKIEDIIGMDV